MILGNEEFRWELQIIAGSQGGREKIHTIDGIKIVDKVIDGNCETYVFETVKNEDWFREIQEQSRILVDPRDSLLRAFRTDPIIFLEQKGYCLVESPKDDDAVLYKRSDRSDAIHWGVWGNGEVRSKWADWYVFEHDLKAVPINYGDEAIFLRKQFSEKI